MTTRLPPMRSRYHFRLQIVTLALLLNWGFLCGIGFAERIAFVTETGQQDEQALATLEQALKAESVRHPIHHVIVFDATAVIFVSEPFHPPSHEFYGSSSPAPLPRRSLYQVFSVYRI